MTGTFLSFRTIARHLVTGQEEFLPLAEMTRQANVLFAKGTPGTLSKTKLFTQVTKKNQCKQLKERPSGRFYEKRFLSLKRSSIIKQPSSDGAAYLFLKLSRVWPTMILIRRGFYLIAGFTFPGFWMIHASGYGAIVYQPIQHFFHTSTAGWPSLITATLIYLAATGCFEACWRLLKNTRP